MIDATKCKALLNALFQDYPGPSFSVRFWNGEEWQLRANSKSICTVVIHSHHALSTLVLSPSEVSLGEAFINKEIDIEGDLFSVFDIGEHLFHSPSGVAQRLLEATWSTLSGIGRWWRAGLRHSEGRDRNSISYHYDQPTEFYRPWLGKSMVYSCAYFRTPDDTIDQAQWNKLELVCQKLRLQPCQRFMDIGCGWGSLVLHAGSRHNVEAHGITISREQARVAQARIEAAHLTQTCTVALTDYRQARATIPFDKIASVGMFEHVGRQNLPLYFSTAHSLLKPGGVFLNHGIARAEKTSGPRTSFLGQTVMPFLRNVLRLDALRHSSFIDKYVFPDGELVTISDAMRAAEAAGFEVRDVENLREHYELTLRCWVNDLRKVEGHILGIVPEKTYRVWLLYMAGSAAAFRRGDIAVYQTLLSRPHHGESHLPLTREDWYNLAPAREEINV
jgi:cyclopropane-fatty-acyl-phospholipid synthase